MQATTIKLDAQLHGSIRKLKPRDQTLTGYVRDLVAREERRAVLEAAAEAFIELIATNQAEAKAMAAWESASLAVEPAIRKPA